MKALEKILNVFIRIINILIICLTIFIFICMGFLMLFVLIPLEVIVVTPVFYVITGKWYLSGDAFDNLNLYRWFPIVFNMETYYDNFPNLTIPEINLSKYYGRDKKHTSL